MTMITIGRICHGGVLLGNHGHDDDDNNADDVNDLNGGNEPNC